MKCPVCHKTVRAWLPHCWTAHKKATLAYIKSHRTKRKQVLYKKMGKSSKKGIIQKIEALLEQLE